ncbi:hypothetical protein [Methanosarcina mazei]
MVIDVFTYLSLDFGVNSVDGYGQGCDSKLYVILGNSCLTSLRASKVSSFANGCWC